MFGYTLIGCGSPRSAWHHTRPSRDKISNGGLAKLITPTPVRRDIVREFGNGLGVDSEFCLAGFAQFQLGGVFVLDPQTDIAARCVVDLQNNIDRIADRKTFVE